MRMHIGVFRADLDLYSLEAVPVAVRTDTHAVSCIALQSDDGDQVAFFLQDIFEITDSAVEKLKNIISKNIGIKSEHIYVAEMRTYVNSLRLDDTNVDSSRCSEISYIDFIGGAFSKIALSALENTLTEPFCIGDLLASGNQSFFSIIIDEKTLAIFDKYANLPYDVATSKQMRRICRILRSFTSTGKCDIRDDTIRRAISVLEEQYGNAVTTRDVARTVGLERSYFSTVFKAQVGMSPHRYLILLRLLNACLLIERTNEPLSRIAEAVGLDPQNFSRFFKRELGIMPREYKSNRSS